MSPFIDFLVDSLGFGATFMYGSTGEIITEKAGHLNLGIPGIMCMGGAGGCLVINMCVKAGFPPFLIVILGILGSFLMGALMGLIYSFLTVTLRANQNVTGLALTTFGVGLMKVLMSDKKLVQANTYLVNPKNYFRFPFASHTDSLHTLGVMFFIALIIALGTGWILYRTRVGLNLRSIGENPATADAAGINVTRYKYLATCAGSGISALGGLYYIMDYMCSQEAYLSLEAFGWLSIALVIFVLWKPHITIPGAFIFGVLFSCSSHIANLSFIKVTMAAKPLLKMLPYVFTIVVLIISSVRNRRENRPPKSLGISYFREER